MDNITHSLVGVALADAMAGRRGTNSKRPLLVGAGILAANFPDIDIAYTAITPAPLGYLLHHRGHTHTIVGLGVLLVILVLAYRMVPSVRAMRTAERMRFWLLITVALTSHLAMDALNTYGVHPLHPFDRSWYFVDAVFIFEPALWVVLGVAAAWNARTGRSKLLAIAPIAILLATILFIEAVPAGSASMLALGGGAFAWATSRASPRSRAWIALAATLIVISVQVAASHQARTEVRRMLRPLLRGPLVDIVLTPNPTSPVCWGVIGIELNERTGEYVLWRGTLSLAPALQAAGSCASFRFAGLPATQTAGGGAWLLTETLREPLRPLRDLAGRDCWARAWLRFGRVPVVRNDELFDLRFEERRAGSFTRMRLVRGPDERGCPSFVPDWAMPRQDLLAR